MDEPAGGHHERPGGHGKADALIQSSQYIIFWRANGGGGVAWALLVLNGAFSVGMLFAFVAYQEQFKAASPTWWTACLNSACSRYRCNGWRTWSWKNRKAIFLRLLPAAGGRLH